jgi:hypothetical protein
MTHGFFRHRPGCFALGSLVHAIRPAAPMGITHTVENRTKRKAMQERRNKLAQDMKALGKNIGRGQQSLAQIHQNVETNLSLARHAETWSWKEVATSSQKIDGVTH